MIQKQYRFKSWDGFIQIVLKNGKSARSDNLSLRTLADTHPYIQSRFIKLTTKRPSLNSGMQLSPKFAVVVSKKVSKSAVTRNRIRRRIFEWIRLNLKELDQTQLTMIFVHTDSVANLRHEDLCLQLEYLFKKANLYKSS
jgi:ribonuclease P protein component